MGDGGGAEGGDAGPGWGGMGSYVRVDTTGRPAIAQLAEHLTIDRSSHQMVPGSIPGGRGSYAGTDPAPGRRGCGAKGGAEERGGERAGWSAGGQGGS